MRKLVYCIMKLFFLLCKAAPLQPKKVLLLKNFPLWGSLGALGAYLEGQGWHVVRANARSPFLLYHIATAKFLCLNNNYSPLARLPLRQQTKVIQLWHADGALKRWGGEETPYPYHAVVCASEQLRPFWAQAFQLPLARVLPLGSPRTDQLAQPCNAAALRAAFDARHPSCKGKRLVLYAPTFRENPEGNASLLSHFPWHEFAETFPETALLVRLHPKLHGAYTLPAGIDVTSEPDPAALLRISACLITDYSSLCVDAAVLDVPIVLYQFDEASYLSRERGFFVPFRTLAPGPIANDSRQLLALLGRPAAENAAQRRAFAAFHAGPRDGKACQRIAALFSPVSF
jgi:CDP-ribitol ribitolphosphotransferase